MLVSCSTSEEIDFVDYYPLGVNQTSVLNGDSYHFNGGKKVPLEKWRVEIKHGGQQRVKGREVFVLYRNYDISDGDNTRKYQYRDYITYKDGQVLLLASKNNEKEDWFEKPWVLYPRYMQIGESYTIQNPDVTVTYTPLEISNVSVNGETYQDCLVLKQEEKSEDVEVTTLYLAPGIGTVKSETIQYKKGDKFWGQTFTLESVQENNQK